VAAQVCKAYFALAEAEGQVRLAVETVGNRERAEERVMARYQRGLRGPLDLHLARTERAAAEMQAAVRKLQQSGAKRQLEILLGRYPAASLEAAELPSLGAPPPAGLPAALIARRPDLVAAERGLAASDRQAAVARASLYPRIMLTGSSGTATEALSDLTDYGDYGVWTLAASVVQPLFQGGRLRAGVRAADARVEEARANFVRAALRAYAEVESDLAAEQRLAEQEAALETAATASRAARELAASRYERGLAGALLLLDAQRSSYDAESRLLEVRRRRLDNRVNLHLALGGDFLAGGAPQERSEDDAS
jgi:NodT family efflux transporter outer membrane factor (OMF) lipoprotein